MFVKRYGEHNPDTPAQHHAEVMRTKGYRTAALRARDATLTEEDKTRISAFWEQPPQQQETEGTFIESVRRLFSRGLFFKCLGAQTVTFMTHKGKSAVLIGEEHTFLIPREPPISCIIHSIIKNLKGIKIDFIIEGSPFEQTVNKKKTYKENNAVKSLFHARNVAAWCSSRLKMRRSDIPKGQLPMFDEMCSPNVRYHLVDVLLDLPEHEIPVKDLLRQQLRLSKHFAQGRHWPEKDSLTEICQRAGVTHDGAEETYNKLGFGNSKDYLETSLHSYRRRFPVDVASMCFLQQPISDGFNENYIVYAGNHHHVTITRWLSELGWRIEGEYPPSNIREEIKDKKDSIENLQHFFGKRHAGRALHQQMRREGMVHRPTEVADGSSAEDYSDANVEEDTDPNEWVSEISGASVMFGGSGPSVTAPAGLKGATAHGDNDFAQIFRNDLVRRNLVPERRWKSLSPPRPAKSRRTRRGVTSSQRPADDDDITLASQANPANSHRTWGGVTRSQTASSRAAGIRAAGSQQPASSSQRPADDVDIAPASRASPAKSRRLWREQPVTRSQTARSQPASNRASGSQPPVVSSQRPAGDDNVYITPASRATSSQQPASSRR